MGMLLVGLLVLAAGIVVMTAVIGLFIALLALAVKLIPLLLIGVIVVKLVRATERRRFAVYASDQRWLDS